MINRRGKTKRDPRGRTLIAHHNSQSPISEQYRTLRTNIDFASIDGAIKTLLITSTAQSEGKTTTAGNLAVVMAQQGKKILLMDADLRKPALHYMFHVNNSFGVTSILGRQAEVDAVIRQTEVPNLDLLCSGPIPPNPSELLGSNAMRNLLNELSELYDIIIIDSPPVLAVTDAQVLANLVNGSLLVIHSGATEKEAAIKARERLMNTKGKLLGVVLNRKSPKDQDSGYYYYSH